MTDVTDCTKCTESPFFKAQTGFKNGHGNESRNGGVSLYLCFMDHRPHPYSSMISMVYGIKSQLHQPHPCWHPGTSLASPEELRQSSSTGDVWYKIDINIPYSMICSPKIFCKDALHPTISGLLESQISWQF